MNGDRTLMAIYTPHHTNPNPNMTKTTTPGRLAALAASAVAFMALQGCSSIPSKDIGDEGQVRQAVFPDPARDAWMKEGAFVNMDDLRTIGPGLTKEQLRGLAGAPHFGEGLGGVREWDYLFELRTRDGAAAKCQYKVVFDRASLARSFHWKPAACADLLARERAGPPR
jgi:OOP family OmpA-OmpF porin